MVLMRKVLKQAEGRMRQPTGNATAYPADFRVIPTNAASQARHKSDAQMSCSLRELWSNHFVGVDKATSVEQYS